MSIGTQACEIVLPGYTLTERIGAGGYAEVWRAEAPGGIQKAVKVVYGYYDDEFASQELKALERIKGVRHPFLLSLERFEVLNGRLAILTELADMSLDQRLRQCRGEGLHGIPREELLRYMADAAEALDFLSQKHSLLHLDIKPENLLVLGDHIKVADFGLVKELASRTQNSLVSGMTPTYAAPEVFDDDPSAFSDQYSLAIVYQEMLVGALPFPGRTAAQLAKQHTQAEPQLTAAPAQDRPILARALAKTPTDRYPSCKAFVAALMCSGNSIPVSGPLPPPHAPIPSNPPPVRPASPEADDTKPPSFCTTLRRGPGERLDQLQPTVTQPVRRDKPAPSPPRAEPVAVLEPLLPEETVDVAVPPIDVSLHRTQPTLYIAVGGVGIQVLGRLLPQIAPGESSENARDAFDAIAFDTNRDELREACSAKWKKPLGADDAVHLPLRLPSSYEDSREILGWISRRWLYNIPRSLETRGYRPLGRVALVDNSRRVLGLVDRKLERLANSVSNAGVQRDATIKVVLLAGSGGGTGAGMVIDIANAVKSLAADRQLSVEVHGYLVCTCFASNSSSPLVAANTYSLLAELSHVATHGNAGSGENAGRAESFESPQSPFDHLYWVPARARTKEAPTTDTLDTLASYLALSETTEGRAAFNCCRSSKTSREESLGKSLSLRRLGYASLADQNRKFISDLADDLVCEVKLHWLRRDQSADWESLVQEAELAANTALLVPVGNGQGVTPAVVPVNETAPLALRGRFQDRMSLEFTSEVLRQIQRRLESRDDRGRPLILSRDAKAIADTARNVAGALAKTVDTNGVANARIADSPVLQKLVATVSRRVLCKAVESFDIKQPERFLSSETIDDVIRSECQAALEEGVGQAEVPAAIEALVDVDQAASATLQNANADLLACGSERRTLIFTPRENRGSRVVQKLQSERPLAAVVPSTVDEVVVVSEEAGVLPRSLALGLERVFPGIVDAARRLHTRVDIDWRKLT